MNIFAKFCCFVLLPYRVSTILSKFSILGGILSNISTNPSPDIPSIPNKPDLVSAYWFHQKLDHFSTDDTRTWKQLYFANYNHYNGRGPVFLMVGGLVEIAESEIRSGAWIEYAESIGAAIYYLEHRFYGLSRPRTECNDEDLVYLNSEQALADLAWFIVSMRQDIQHFVPFTTQWIAFGASYGGTLAARLRLKYPHLIHGAVTSSSPFLEIVNFKEYFEIIEEEFDKHPGVKDEIREAFKLVYREIETGAVGLEKKLSLCTHLRIHDKGKNKNYLFWNLSYTLGYIMRYGKLEFTKLKDDVMKTMVDGSKSNALDRLASAIQKILQLNGAKCLSVDYEEAIRVYKLTSWNEQISRDFALSGGLGTRPILYQRCTEFGKFETSDQESGLFGNFFPLGFYVGICSDVFGKQFDFERLNNGVARTNIFYGGSDIAVSRVLFVNGGQDLLNGLGIIKSKSDDQISIYIPNAFHCDDMRSAKEFPRLRESQRVIFNILLQWLYIVVELYEEDANPIYAIND